MEQLKKHMQVNPISVKDSQSTKEKASEEPHSGVSSQSLGKQGADAKPEQGTSLKILLVEDTPINLKLVQHQVRLLGHQWDSVENGHS